MPSLEPIMRIYATTKDAAWEEDDPIDYVDIWYRRDLGEVRMRVDGVVVTLFRQGKLAGEAMPPTYGKILSN